MNDVDGLSSIAHVASRYLSYSIFVRHLINQVRSVKVDFDSLKIPHLRAE